tara:strand:- start:220 stop:1413 length:1194 start_codon:yes stop_codon:yes gene_type:complete
MKKLCEVCGSNNLIEVLNLGKHPLCDDLVKFNDSRICKEYPIIIDFCPKCTTAHQRFQVSKIDLFTKSYHYRARMTGSVLSGMKDLVENCQTKFGSLANKKVLDIGCNDGSLLNFFKEKGCDTFGIDPTDAVMDSTHKSIQAFFDSESSLQILNDFGKPDIISFTNVFAHIENLPELLNSLKILLKKDSLIVIENHYLGAVLNTNQFDTFYHEHPRTYSYKSFEYIAETLGLKLADAQFVSRYGGNIRVFLTNNQINNKSLITDVIEDHFLNDFKKISKHVKNWVEYQSKNLKGFVSENGKIRAKAFPGRAAILIKLLGLDENHISAVYEIKGSIKTNHYVPGTRIPILPEKELYNLDVQTEPILNLAWHIPGEVRANLLINGYKGEVIDIKPIKAS